MEGFLLALTFLNEEERKTVPVVLQSFVGRGDVDWGAVMATSVLYMLPVAIVFVLASQAPDDGPDRRRREGVNRVVLTTLRITDMFLSVLSGSAGSGLNHPNACATDRPKGGR